MKDESEELFLDSSFIILPSFPSLLFIESPDNAHKNYQKCSHTPNPKRNPGRFKRLLEPGK
jgi:hypothetical protein